jgi:hypothetical protein
MFLLLFDTIWLAAATTGKRRALELFDQKTDGGTSGVCPTRPAYEAPSGCKDDCYSKMSKWMDDSNADLGNVGSTFTASICGPKNHTSGHIIKM